VGHQGQEGHPDSPLAQEAGEDHIRDNLVVDRDSQVAVVPLDPNAPSREEVARKNQVVASVDNPLDQVVSNRQVVVHTLVVVGLLDSLAAPSQEEAVLEDHLDAVPTYAHRDLLCQEHRKVAAA
jgi:hypothetical protein